MWPDFTAGMFELRDVANLVIGVLGVILAGYAIKMGRDQDKVTDRQLDLSEKMSNALQRLTDLEEEQGKIAGIHKRLLERELSRTTELTLVNGVELHGDYGWVTLYFLVRNAGAKPVETFDWELVLDPRMDDNINFVDRAHPQGAAPKVINWVKGRYEGKLFHRDDEEIGAIRIKDPQKAKELRVRWRIKTDDGQFPASNGWGLIELKLHEGQEGNSYYIATSSTQYGEP